VNLRYGGVLDELRARLQVVEEQVESAAEEGLNLEKPLAYVRETLAFAEKAMAARPVVPSDLIELAKRLHHIRNCGYGSRCR
jgi:hypothetical protein